MAALEPCIAVAEFRTFDFHVFLWLDGGRLICIVLSEVLSSPAARALSSFHTHGLSPSTRQ